MVDCSPDIFLTIKKSEDKAPDLLKLKQLVFQQPVRIRKLLARRWWTTAKEIINQISQISDIDLTVAVAIT